MIREIYLKNGTVKIPEDWIFVEDPECPASEATDLAVVEAFHHKELGIPIFAVPINEKKITYEMYDKLIDLCCEAYPELKHVVALQVNPPTDSMDVAAADYQLEAHIESPYLVAKRVASTDDPDYDQDREYPYDVVVDVNIGAGS